MTEISNYFILIITLISTLLGFVGVIFIFWYEVKSRGNKQGYIQNAKDRDFLVVNRYEMLVYIGIASIMIFFMLVFSIYVDVIEDFQTKLVMGVSFMFILIWVFKLGQFFLTIHKDVTDKLKK